MAVFGDHRGLAAVRLVQEYRRERSQARAHVRVSRPWIRHNLRLSVLGAWQVSLTDAMTTLASKNPDIFIAMTAGTSCTQSVVEAAQNGMKEKVKYLWQPTRHAQLANGRPQRLGHPRPQQVRVELRPR